MPYDPRLFERIKDALARKVDWTEKDALGGRVCIVNGREFIGAVEDGLIALCDAESLQRHLALKHCSEFKLKDKVQPGWVKVSMDALKTAKQLSRWVEAAYTYCMTLPAKSGAKKAAVAKK
ncbi:MAG: hypothetical protein IT462_17435 [Planctomycetes bacterium]|nr:hypothetical protein [Planctomycetota bacterium]